MTGILGATDFSAQKANRQTALRYLRLAKNYAIQGDWKKSLAAATAGNNYDATVADLWYLIALSQYNEGATRKAVLPVLKKSLGGAAKNTEALLQAMTDKRR